MIDILSLLKALPVSGLEPQWMAVIEGFGDKESEDWRKSRIYLLEPPAGQHVPFIDPVQAMTVIFNYQGTNSDFAATRATAKYAELRPQLQLLQRVRFYDFLNSDSPECIQAPVLIRFLREQELASEALICFLERAVDAVMRIPIFQGPDNWDTPWSLLELPDLPTPKSMIEFIPSPSWDDPTGEDDHKNRVSAWREEIRPVAEDLEKRLGEPVYYFADPDCDYDDDSAHRFLTLHCCCMLRPESSFVRFLIEASGAQDVEEFKSAMISPESYTHPFKMNDAFVGLESRICHLEYIPPTARKVVGIAFSTFAARPWAESLLWQQINADVFIVAPKMLAPDEWIKSATKNCQNWRIQYLYDGKLDNPIEVLSRVDELYVVADEKSPSSGFDLRISAPTEDLLWRAHVLQVPTKFFCINGSQLGNPETSLEARGVPERVAGQDKLRELFTHQLEEIRVDCDYCSSGLWDSRGQMLGYDLLSLPFPLVRRLAAWQLDFDETENPPATGDEAWWNKHEHEEIEIAKDLQASLGVGTRIKVFRNAHWEWIGDINS